MLPRRPDRGPRFPRGFTLLEMVLVLGLLGLLAGVVLVSGRALLDVDRRDSAEQTALEMIARARHEAVAQNSVLTLDYDQSRRQFRLGQEVFDFSGKEEARLLPPSRVSAQLIGGRLVESSMPRVRFYPDGTCDPFRLEVVGEQFERILEFDPWTCAPLQGKDNKS